MRFAGTYARVAIAVTSTWLVAEGALADGVLVHEFFEPAVEEDLRLSATTSDGTMAAVLETKSGVVSAPPQSESRLSSRIAYGGNSTAESRDRAYRIDRNTTQPSVVQYDDPFRPTITPFKRLYAYDMVDEQFDLGVSNRTLSPISIGGEANERDDQFYADLNVDVDSGTPARIPSVGPGARVLAARVEPPVPFELFRDGADNWFIRAPERLRLRLVMQLAIDRAAFGSAFTQLSWSRLRQYVVPIPVEVRASAEHVLGKLGLSQQQSPKQAVSVLIDHFRSFEPSSDLPSAGSKRGLYEELALSQKGVCRHRAYAFVVTALALGLPSRLVRNEAHAWVEVFDSEIWHRIDLGGAASRFEFDSDPSVPAHRPPRDPYAWPEGSQSALQMAERGQSGQASSNVGAPPAATSTPQGNPGSSQSAPRADQAALPESSETEQNVEDDDGTLTPAHLELAVEQTKVERGASLSLRGAVSADAGPCPYARIDVTLSARARQSIPIGALPADDQGRFQGSVTVPLQIPVGDYRVVVSTPGVRDCGPGSSEP